MRRLQARKAEIKRKHITSDVEGNRLKFRRCSFMNDVFHPEWLFIFVLPLKDYSLSQGL